MTMKHTVMFLALAALGAFLWAADPSASDERAVRAAVQQFNDAARKGDEASLNKLLAPDLIYVTLQREGREQGRVSGCVSKRQTGFSDCAWPAREGVRQ